MTHETELQRCVRLVKEDHNHWNESWLETDVCAGCWKQAQRLSSDFEKWLPVYGGHRTILKKWLKEAERVGLI